MTNEGGLMIVLGNGYEVGSEADAACVAALVGRDRRDHLGLYDLNFAFALTVRRGDPNDPEHRALVRRLDALIDDAQAHRTYDYEGL